MIQDFENLKNYNNENSKIHEKIKYNPYKLQKFFPNILSDIDSVIFPFTQKYAYYFIEEIYNKYGEFICLGCELLDLYTIQFDILIDNNEGLTERKNLIFKINLVSFNNEFIKDIDDYVGDVDDFDVEEYLSEKFDIEKVYNFYMVDVSKQDIITYLINNHSEFISYPSRINFKQEV